MSALGNIIDAAVASVLAEHPKLFDPKGKDRAHRVLVREIMKSLTRETPSDEEGPPSEPQQTAAFDAVGADDPRAVAYANLRAVAGATLPRPFAGGKVYLPAEADTTAVRAFAEMPARAAWLFISDRAKLTAWLEFFEATLPAVARRKITVEKEGVVGVHLPWPWPPSKTGKVYSAEEAPPAAESIE